MAGNASASRHRHGAAVSAIRATHARGQSARRGHHKISPAGSVRIKESLSSLRPWESGRNRSDQDVYRTLRAQGLRLLQLVQFRRHPGNRTRRLYLEQSFHHHRARRPGRGGLVVSVWRLDHRREGGPGSRGACYDLAAAASAACGAVSRHGFDSVSANRADHDSRGHVHVQGWEGVVVVGDGGWSLADRR